MKNIIKLPILSAALLAGAAFTNPASAITVGGVDIGPAGSGFSILASQVYETVVTGTSQTLLGAGQVTAVNGNTNFVGGGQQLNFVFSTTSTFFSNTQTVFQGGFVTFYLDPANTFTTAINQAPPSAAITAGTLWLNTAFVTVAAPAPFNTLVAQGGLFGTGTGFSANNFLGSGLGNLNVVSGLADVVAALDTNFFDILTCTAISGTTCTATTPGKADFSFSSSFNLPGGTVTLPITGTTAIVARPVPEPGSTVLLGMGLLMAFGAMRNRANKA